MTTQTAIEKWEAVAALLTAADLRALGHVWFERGKLNDEEETRLRIIFDQHSFGEANFKTWLKQTLRQVHENAVLGY